MKNHLLLTAFLLISSGNFLFSQNPAAIDNTLAMGEITGTVRNSETGHVVPNIAIIILKDGDLITGTVADDRGKFQIQKIAVGTYDLKISGSEFQDKLNSGIQVAANKTTLLEPQFTEIDFKRQCLCIFKTDRTQNQGNERQSAESSWIPVHILKQSLGF